MATTPTSAVITAYYAALRAGDVESWLALFAPDAVVVNPVGTAPVSGTPALRELWEELTCPFQRLEVVEDVVFASDRTAAVSWAVRAVGLSGQVVATEGIDVVEVDDAGRISRLTSYWEPAQLRDQLCEVATPDGGGSPRR